MDISIIIVNYRSWKPLEKCLESILTIQNNKIELEVIVVDNFSNDKQFAAYNDKFINIKFIQNAKNHGYSYGCNIGVKKAQGDYFMFLNPDTILSSNTIETLLLKYKKNTEIGILSCLQLNNKDKLYNYKKRFPFLLDFSIPIHFTKKENKNFNNSTKDELFYPDWVTGSLIFISRTWLDKVNGWNEDYWLYFEDVDICKKINNLNGKVAITNQTTILHKHGGSSRINFETECTSKTEVIISKHVYINNNYSPLSKIPAHFLLILYILIKKTILSLISFIFFCNLKLKTNRYILINLFQYYTNALHNKTWLSKQSINYPKHYE